MNRLFGSKPQGPKPNLNQAIQQLDERVDSLDVKIAKINAELSAIQQKVSNMRDGPGKTALKRKALTVLQRRKQLEAQKDQYQQQSWNMEQASMLQDNLKNVAVTVDALKTTNKELKKQYGKINIDQIERLQDEMADLMDIGNDIQDAMSRTYDVPEDVDEEELDAEFEALAGEMEAENELAGLEGGLPSYLQPEVLPEFVDAPPLEEGKGKEAVQS